MTTSRILLFGVAALTLLFAGSIVVIDGVSRRPAATILAPVQAMEAPPQAAARPAAPPPWVQERRAAVQPAGASGATATAPRATAKRL